MTKKKPISKEEKLLIKKSATLFAIALLAVVIAEAFDHRHTVFAIEETPAFYALFGFISCVIIVIIAKWLGKLLKREEHYYDNQENN